MRKLKIFEINFIPPANFYFSLISKKKKKNQPHTLIYKVDHFNIFYCKNNINEITKKANPKTKVKRETTSSKPLSFIF